MGRVAQRWSNRLIIDRLLVRIQPRPPLKYASRLCRVCLSHRSLQSTPTSKCGGWSLNQPAGPSLRMRETLQVCFPTVRESVLLRLSYPRVTTSPSSCNPTRIAHTYLGSITTAFPKVSRSAGRCSSIQSKAAGEIGRSRKTNRGFHRENQALVNYLTLQTNRYAKSSFLRLREDALKILGSTKVGFAPYRPYPFFRSLAPWPFLWLGCRTAEIAATLDTFISLPQISWL